MAVTPSPEPTSCHHAPQPESRLWAFFHPLLRLGRNLLEFVKRLSARSVRSGGPAEGTVEPDAVEPDTTEPDTREGDNLDLAASDVDKLAGDLPPTEPRPALSDLDQAQPTSHETERLRKATPRNETLWRRTTKTSNPQKISAMVLHRKQVDPHTRRCRPGRCETPFTPSFGLGGTSSSS